ncbi:MAG: antibiotic biosynthesis monooxygenase [Pseudomonadaceae bacterium]|nr:antibiotic biosynthesis monooxygenase [Pseudomonadaceae bacterium]
MRRTRQPARLAALGVIACGLFISTPVLAQCDENEVGYVASFTVKSGSEAGFEAAVTALADTVNRVEKGVLLYAPYRGPEGQYFMMERYANEDARKAHGTDPEVTALFPALGEFMAAPPVVTPVSAVCS